MKTVIGLFKNRTEAKEVVQGLINNGFEREQISMMASEVEPAGAEKTGMIEEGEFRAKGAAKGAGAGAAIGGAAGILVGITSLVVPGLGPVVAAGPLAALLTGVGVGAVTGGIIGALTDMGVPEQHAGFYEEGVRRGGFLVTVAAEEDAAERAADIMRRFGAEDIEKQAESWRGAEPQAYDAEGLLQRRAQGAETATVPGEEFSASPKPEGYAATPEREGYAASRQPEGYTAMQEQESYGSPINAAATAAKEPETFAQDQEHGPGYVAGQRPQGFGAETDAELLAQRERQGVAAQEPGAYSGQPAAAPVSEREMYGGEPEMAQQSKEEQYRAESGREGVVPVMEPEMISTMSTEVSEEGEIVYHSQHRVDAEFEALRREGEGLQPEESLEDQEFHRHFDTTYSTGERFEAYRSAYHYAESKSSAASFIGKEWPEVEEDIHQDWERTHPEPWTKVREAIHYGWDHFHRRH